jgi:hypothetical protein
MAATSQHPGAERGLTGCSDNRPKGSRRSRFPLVTIAFFAGLLIAAGPAAASRPAQPATAWTIYGDVIVEVASPKDPHTGVVLRRVS